MADARPTVTVGMPVYNDPEGMQRSVPTVFAQTWQGPIRLLVVDDGSTDDTPEVLDDLSSMCGPIEVIRNPENMGRPVARNQILQHVDDGYLAWLDSGDLWHPRKLELQFAVLDEEGDADRERLICTSPIRWIFLDRDEHRIKVPVVDGDQLYNALSGDLYPYLWAMLGHVNAFRSVDGFDERLSRRQDYDFFVRFVAAGGRVVTTSEETPLATYVKTDEGRSPRDIAISNDIIRRKHRDLIRGYGLRFALTYRRNQLMLVARFYGNNNDAFRYALYKTVATAFDPTTWPRSTMSLVKALLRPVRRPFVAAVRWTSRRLMPVLPWLRRSGVTSLARRLGIVRAAAASGAMRVFYDEIRPSVSASHQDYAIDYLAEILASCEGVADADAVDAIQKASDAIGRADFSTAVEALRQVPNSAADGLHPEFWLVLERANREDGSLQSAQNALEEGLRLHPGDPGLKVRLIELLSLRTAWRECLEQWNKLGEDAGEHLRGLTYARVARSHRLLGEIEDALKVAEAGTRAYSNDPRVWDEFYASRALTVDWRGATRGGAATRDEDGQTGGAVSSLGFLAGEEGPITGWVLSSVAAPTVSLLVNDKPVAQTHANVVESSTNERQKYAFSMSCDEVREYLGDGDVISIRSQGRLLDIDGRRSQLVIVTGYPSRFPVLRKSIDSGYVFTKFGHFRQGNTRERKRATLALYHAVGSVIKEQFGYASFPFYGNLLGAIRDHDFIPHDVGGFDMGYVSQSSTPGDVKEEFIAICSMLLDRGFFLKLEPWSAYVRANRADKFFVDVNYAWFTTSGKLHFSFGWRYAPVTNRERFFFPRTCPIDGYIVKVPGNAEAVLQQIYGVSWPIPDQGFSLDLDLKRSRDFLLSKDDMHSLVAAYPNRAQIRSIPSGDIAVVSREECSSTD